ncbi:MAG: glycosyltransferase [Nitrospinaceae bacterium]|nr:glycosyltransferase [Nitrospinaceae bacterium]MBT4431741.1 glycosyltransferase [Nitrospinaceae bacterium]MBT5369742.1 glycosyltransferase [Nitrospinaceae bacterium]MBT6395739.1 glycosyltransferase [Nitrospinaceae bacterium]
MRVLHLTSGLSPRLGGPSVLVPEICKSLQNENVEVVLISTDADVSGNLNVPLNQPVETSGVRTYYFHTPFLKKYAFSFQLNTWLKNNVQLYDLVHIHQFFSYVTIPAVHWARRYGKPYIIRPAGQLNSHHIRKNLYVKQLFLLMVGNKILKNADFIHLTSNAELNEFHILKLPGTPRLLSPGLDFSNGGGEPNPEIFYKNHPELRSNKIILFLSRLHPVKGLDLLFPSFKQILKKENNVSLVIAGEPEKGYEKDIQNLLKSNGLENKVIFPGFVEGAEKSGLYSIADIFVLPSYGDNFGVAAYEAMEKGLPVLITDRVGVAPQVEQYGAGLVTGCDSGEISDALLTLLGDKELREKMGKQGAKLARDEFSWEKSSRELIKSYDMILSSESQ